MLGERVYNMWSHISNQCYNAGAHCGATVSPGEQGVKLLDIVPSVLVFLSLSLLVLNEFCIIVCFQKLRLLSYSECVLQ